jgi:hypothetical protein
VVREVSQPEKQTLCDLFIRIGNLPTRLAIIILGERMVGEPSLIKKSAIARKINRLTHFGGIMKEILDAHLETYFTVFCYPGLDAGIQP